MALRLSVTTQAKRDAARVLGYIARENAEAAARLAKALEQGMLRLLEYPLSGPVVPNRISLGIRQLIIPPCRILYRIADPDLYIVGVLRCEQDIPEAPFRDL